MNRRPPSRTACVALCLLLSLVPRLPGHESAIAHVDRTVAMWILDSRIHVSYRLQLVESAALADLDAADADGDGRLGDEERRRHFNAAARRLLADLHIDIDGQAAPLALAEDGEAVLDPLLGQTYRFSAVLPPGSAGRRGRLVDGTIRSAPGAIRFLNTPVVPVGAHALVGRLLAGAPADDHDHGDGEHHHEDHASTLVVAFDLPRP